MTIFPESVLEELSINYRYMIRELADNQGELHRNRRFSGSRIHRTSHYMSTGLYKPISNIYLPDEDEDIL